MDKERQKSMAAGIVLAIMVIGPMIILSVVEYLAFRVFGWAGVLVISAFAIWIGIMMRRVNQ